MKNTLGISICLLFLFLASHALGQHAALQSGPMVGYTTLREAMIWAQTTKEAKVSVQYRIENSEDKWTQTSPVNTVKEHGFTAHVVIDQIKSGNVYEYQLMINGKAVKTDYPCRFRSQTHWQFRTSPPDFLFATGSCTYVSEEEFDRPGKPYGGDYQIFTELNKWQPEMMVWLGDNTYFRESDFTSRTGMYYRHTHTRSIPELQPLLARTHNYAIWDDHDYGPNDADGSFIHKDWALQAFQDFWANPSYGINGKPGITGNFTYNDCEFFLMDNRYYRTPQYDKDTTYIWGNEQVEWLIAALKFSRASFKFVATGGQFLNPTQVYENHSLFPGERAYLIRRIREENIRGVIFLTGDRHHSEVSMLKLDDSNVLYDITVSPLTSRAHSKLKEENELRLKRSLILERNFATLKVSGEWGKRVLEVTYYSSDGKKLYNLSINQPDY